jgi:glycosyltransferase involved in cell wall biosynthesis
VASGDCYIGLLAWIVACLTGASFVFDIYDKYDEFAGYRKPFGFDLFGFLIRRARLSLFASRALAERLSSVKPGGAAEVAPNGVDGQMFHPMDIARCREALDLDPGMTLIGYFGGMEPDRGVVDLIQAIEKLRSGGADIKLLICGKAHPSTPLSHDWIIYRGMVTHGQMPLYLNASNVLVVPYRLSEFMDMGASCKIAEYLMCGKPLVSTSTPNLTANFPVQALELGQALCRPEDAADLARAIDYQLHQGTLVSMPQHMKWPDIAAAALRAITRNTGDSPIGR